MYNQERRRGTPPLLQRARLSKASRVMIRDRLRSCLSLSLSRRLEFTLDNLIATDYRTRVHAHTRTQGIKHNLSIITVCVITRNAKIFSSRDGQRFTLHRPARNKSRARARVDEHYQSHNGTRRDFASAGLTVINGANHSSFLIPGVECQVAAPYQNFKKTRRENTRSVSPCKYMIGARCEIVQ